MVESCDHMWTRRRPKKNEDGEKWREKDIKTVKFHHFEC